MIEHERSYVFTHEGAHDFLKEHGMSLHYKPDDPDPSIKVIEDYYLGQGMRVRKSWKESEAAVDGATYVKTDDGDGKERPKINIGHAEHGRSGLPGENISYVFTRKTGDKSKGYRFEFEEPITETLAKALAQDVVMTVKKVRKKLPIGNDSYTITMDFVEEPMKLAILEIEALKEVVYPIPADITKKLFGVELKECPLCAYSLFNRHFGIAGGPSSGKSETAKELSHTLNTKYQANSFHVAEFATTFIQKYKKNPNFWEEFFIWHGQHEREHAAGLANIVISDCPTFLTYVYLLHLPKEKFSSSTALVLAKMYKRVLFDIDWYSDLIFLKLKNYKENSIRYQSKEEAMVIENRVLGFLDDHNIKYSTYDYTEGDQILRDLFYIN